MKVTFESESEEEREVLIEMINSRATDVNFKFELFCEDTTLVFAQVNQREATLKIRTPYGGQG
jgi:hypothetical protein